MTERTIFKALNKVQADLAKQGIGKDQVNQYDKYQFRGIDALLDTLGPILAKHGVLIIPAVIEREVHQVATAKGGTANHATLTVNYHFYDTEGDSIVHQVVGEALDRGDKALNKALTAAYKYLVFQAFAIPLVGEDADESHQLGGDSARVKAPTITAEQAAEIQHMIEDTGTDTTAFCKWLGAGSIAEIAGSEVARARQALENKRAKLASAEIEQGSDHAE